MPVTANSAVAENKNSLVLIGHSWEIVMNFMSYNTKLSTHALGPGYIWPDFSLSEMIPDGGLAGDNGVWMQN
jgi:hypothetical protein